jgi:hypothetical protein
MRNELADAVKNVMENIDIQSSPLDDEERETLLQAANLVTLARTAVWRDRQGKVTDAHAPEMPTRFAKQLTQVVRGGVAVGLTRTQAMRLAIRCARDSMPPLRLAILRDLAEHPNSMPTQVRKRLDKPHTTVDRELQELHLLNLVTLGEESYMNSRGEEKFRWRYSLKDQADVGVVLPDSSLDPQGRAPFLGSSLDPPRGWGGTDISGNGCGVEQPTRSEALRDDLASLDGALFYDDGVNNNHCHASYLSHPAPPVVDLCLRGEKLLAPHSIARRHCEACALAKKREEREKASV